MSQKIEYTKSPSAKSVGEKQAPDALPSDIAEVLIKAQQYLDEQAPEKALHVIKRSRIASPWIINATGVCAMRLGNVKQAATLFQGLVSQHGILLKPDAPIVFKINFATALLASNNLEGALSVLHEIGQEEHPTVKCLRNAIRQWKQQLSPRQKFKCCLGDYPDKPIVLDFALGQLK